jgi:hypothetical protein
MSSDPLLTLLRRYQAELEAFEPPIDCLRVAQNTWVGTRDKIIRSRPTATTAIGALAALQHVVQCKDLFDESADLQMLWHLVVAARDYFRAQSLAIDSCDPPGAELPAGSSYQCRDFARCREKEAAPAGCTVRIYNQGHGFSDWDVAILDPVIAKVVALDMAGLPINHRGRVRVTRYLTADDVQTLQLDSGEARKKHRNESPLSPPAGCGMGGLNFWGHDCQSVQPPRTIPPNSAQ